MLSPHLKDAVLHAAATAFKPTEAELIERYLTFSDERVSVSVWVDLFYLARDHQSLAKYDPTGAIRQRLEDKDAVGFFDWWQSSEPPSYSPQLQLPLFH
jgi:hypothetical protein